MAKRSRIEPPSPEAPGARVGDDHADVLRQESEAITHKIDAAYEKLAAKLRGKANKAEASMDTKRAGLKRDILRRRFELYADAANNLEMRLALRSRSPEGD